MLPLAAGLVYFNLNNVQISSLSFILQKMLALKNMLHDEGCWWMEYFS